MDGKGYINILSIDNENAIEKQKKTIEEFAHDKGYGISEFFIDITSSTTNPYEREGFINMLNSFKSLQHNDKALFIMNTGVLHRDALKLLDIIKELKQSGIKVFAAMEDKELTRGNVHEIIKEISEQVQFYDHP